jgi:hypothetical protein
MTESRLQEMWHESAAGIDTSPPPLATIARGARRRRAGAVGLAAAAVVLVGGAAVVVPHVAGGADVAPAGQAPGGAPGSSWDQGPDDVPVLLPTYGRPAGTFQGDAALTGELRLVDQDRCLVVGEDSTPVVWPQGYEGVVRADGTFDLLDESRHEVARAGDEVRLRGHWSGPASYVEECLPDTTPGKVFMVSARPTVID